MITPGRDLKTFMLRNIVQRLPRYQLLLDQLLKSTYEDHPDFENVKTALEKIIEVNSFINEGNFLI
jgi:hypothetical protein